MDKVPLDEPIVRPGKELTLSGLETDSGLLELRGEVDRLRLEVIALKTYLGSAHPSFRELFPDILARTIEDVNPEFD
ncbi:MAG: hypothetical protein C0617_13145 [Desulfuromonas sp.]|uniref:hypothetical protein n=1 Tax=Desulfuromonas sp. TaxID=892 RepID=UPI000CC7138B|nr:hypothetical protein [Desulfuromonas sp.]PLX82813.1 MAG: hypothetical protein C0617_13145 [Desulfuromonas sp.]